MPGNRRGAGVSIRKAGSGAAVPLRDEARLPAEEGDELVAGACWAGEPNRGGEQPRPGIRGDQQRSERQQMGR